MTSDGLPAGASRSAPRPRPPTKLGEPAPLPLETGSEPREGCLARGVIVVRDAPEVGQNPRPGDLVTGFPEKSFANQGLSLGVRVVLDI